MKYGMELKPCSACKKELPFDAYSTDWEWRHAVRKCVGCKREYGVTHKVCSVCKENKPRSAYGLDDQWFASAVDRKCGVCREEESSRGMWKCPKCGLVKSKTNEFTKWLAPNFVEEANEKEAIRKESLRSVIQGGRKA
jgi:hypothetical protein